MKTTRVDAAAATRIFGGDNSLPRRGRVDWRRVIADAPPVAGALLVAPPLLAQLGLILAAPGDEAPRVFDAAAWVRRGAAVAPAEGVGSV